MNPTAPAHFLFCKLGWEEGKGGGRKGKGMEGEGWGGGEALSAGLRCKNISADNCKFFHNDFAIHSKAWARSARPPSHKHNTMGKDMKFHIIIGGRGDFFL